MPNKATKKTAAEQVKVTLMKSTSGRLPRHQATVRCLGLTRRHQSVVLTRTPQIEGMITQVGYLLQIEAC